MNRPHKQSMSELKLRRLMEHNARLKEDLARPRIRVSEASARYSHLLSQLTTHTTLPPSPLLPIHTDFCAYSLIRYCKQTKDHLVSLLVHTHTSTPLMSSLTISSLLTGTFRLGTS